MTDDARKRALEARALVKDIHDAIAELVPVVRYPDLTAAIDRLGELAALSSAAPSAAEPVSKVAK